MILPFRILWITEKFKIKCKPNIQNWNWSKRKTLIQSRMPSIRTFAIYRKRKCLSLNNFSKLNNRMRMIFSATLASSVFRICQKKLFPLNHTSIPIWAFSSFSSFVAWSGIRKNLNKFLQLPRPLKLFVIVFSCFFGCWKLLNGKRKKCFGFSSIYC